MRTNLEKARQLLEAGNCAWVLCKGETLLTDREAGIQPLVRWLDSEKNYRVFSAAGTAVDEASAKLLCELGVKDVYAGTITREAVRLLFSHGIAVLCLDGHTGK